MTQISEAADAGGKNEDEKARATAFGRDLKRVEKILLGFSWSDYRLDPVEDTVHVPDTHDWATDLAAEIVEALARP